MVYLKRNGILPVALLSACLSFNSCSSPHPISVNNVSVSNQLSVSQYQQGRPPRNDNDIASVWRQETNTNTNTNTNTTKFEGRENTEKLMSITQYPALKKRRDIIHVASLNIQALPDIFTKKNYKDERFTAISDFILKNDFVAIQEDFLNVFKNRLPADTYISQNYQGKVLKSGKSGLTSAFNTRKIKHIRTKPFSKCSGRLDAGECFDCLVTKGYQISHDVQSRVYIVNTHMDAGQKPSDVQTRKLQFKELQDAIINLPENARVIFMGDINAYKNDNDLVEFLNKTKLKTVIHQGLDIIAVTENLSVISTSAYDTELDNISDHPAVTATIRI